MPQLSSCPACAGFLPPAAESCPNCHASAASSKQTEAESAFGLGVSTRRAVWSRASRGGRLLHAAGLVASGSVFALTMMACYGIGPVCDDNVDDDGDGFGSCDFDCNDADPNINPAAEDLTADGIDQNCDGVDGPRFPEFGEDAGETDGGAPDGGEEVCEPVDWDRDDYFSCATDGGPVDCDDDNSRIHPGAEDATVDGIDQDCDGFDHGGAPLPSPDAGSTDAGSTDGGSTDAGSTDAGSTDAGSTDAGDPDAGNPDAGDTEL